MANRYWVGGAGTWNTTSTTNWSDTSGGAAGASVPTTADAVFFNASSGSGTITMTGALACAGFDTTGSSFTFNTGTSPTLTCNGSFITSSTTPYNSTGTVTITGTGTINPNGRNFNFPLTINGAGITVTLANNLNISAKSLTITAGTFNTANFNVNCINIVSTGTSTRAINLGSSTVSLQMRNTPITLSGTGLTWNAGTSTLTFSAQILANAAFVSSGYTMYNAIFDMGAGNLTFTDAATFNNLTFNQSSAYNRIQVVTLAADLTVNGTFTTTGAAAGISRVYFFSNIVGTNRTISAAATSITDSDYRNITGSGAAAPFTGTRVGNLGGNSGITFSAPKSVYWNLAGGSSSNPGWASVAWATTDGGTPASANYPLPQDTAIFTNTSPNSGASVFCQTTALGNAFNGYVGIIDCSARTNNMTLVFSNNAGNVTLGSGVYTSGTLTAQNIGTTLTFNQNGGVVNSNITQQATLGYGPVALSNADINGTYTLNAGTLILNTNTSVLTFNANNGNTKQIQFGTSALTVGKQGATAININGTGFTYTGTTKVDVTQSVIKYSLITSGTTFTVPSDFVSLVSVDCIGAGGSVDLGGGGSGGGAFSSSTAVTGLSANSTAYVNIGTAGGDTWLNSTTNAPPTTTSQGALAKGGSTNTTATGGAGGSAASGVGTLKYSGGNGGDNGLGTGGCGSGGAAAGPQGNGANGIQNTISNDNGAPGSGANGGTLGALVNAPGVGFNLGGNGGGAGFSSIGSNGTNGTTYLGAFGPGGSGGGARRGSGTGGAGGLYGGGSGGSANSIRTGTSGAIVFVYIGSPTVDTTVTTPNFTETNSLNFNVTNGAYTFTSSNSNVFKSLDFTGFTGTWTPSTSTSTFYGNLTLVPGMTFNTGSGIWTFANTSGTATVVSAGKTLYRIVQSGDGGTLAFSGPTTLSNDFTFTAGTLKLPSNTTTTVGSFTTTGTTLKYLNSSISGTQATISDASSTNTVTYLSVKDSNAAGGAVWNAENATNVDEGNNTGWLGFVSNTSGGSSNFFLFF